MSLDVRLTLKNPDPTTKPFLIDGQEQYLSSEQWNALFDAGLYSGFDRIEKLNEDRCVYSANITHNLGKMADEAYIYEYLWRPEEAEITKASQLIEPLKKGLELLKSDPARFKQYNASNGWGVYENLVKFVEKYLAACEEYPDADVYASK